MYLNDFNIYIIVGYLFSISVIYFTNKKSSFVDILNNYNILIIIGLLFGKVGFYFVYNNDSNFSVINGNSYLGSQIGLLILYLLSLKTKKIYNYFESLIYIPILMSFGKIGCYFANCCNGIKFFNLIPLQFFEASFHLILFCILINLKLSILQKIKIFFVFNFILRFGLYFLREEQISNFSILNINSLQIALLIYGSLICILVLQKLNLKV